MKPKVVFSTSTTVVSLAYMVYVLLHSLYYSRNRMQTIKKKRVYALYGGINYGSKYGT